MNFKDDEFKTLELVLKIGLIASSEGRLTLRVFLFINVIFFLVDTDLSEFFSYVSDIFSVEDLALERLIGPLA